MRPRVYCLGTFSSHASTAGAQARFRVASCSYWYAHAPARLLLGHMRVSLRLLLVYSCARASHAPAGAHANVHPDHAQPWGESQGKEERNLARACACKHKHAAERLA